MNSSLRLPELGRLIEACLDDPDPRAAERRLLRTLLEGSWCQAAALFHAPASPGTRAPWQAGLAVGPRDLLCDGAALAAVRAGELPSELPLGRHVLFGTGPGGERALVLGGFGLGESALDALEAAFLVLCRLDGSAAPPEDRWQPPFPGAGGSPSV
jgi:hypothetical protein